MPCAPSHLPRRPSRPGSTSRLLGWLTAPICLTTAVAGAALVTRGPAALFGWTVGALLALGLLWVLMSSLFPAVPDRTCPACGARGLQRSSPEALRGLRCSACGFEDPDASAFLMAEEEGPLEDSVLRERGRKHGPLRRSRA